jgi:ABC-type dipeptide/oligopeptide/nickel transport system ATPase component
MLTLLRDYPLDRESRENRVRFRPALPSRPMSRLRRLSTFPLGSVHKFMRSLFRAFRIHLRFSRETSISQVESSLLVLQIRPRLNRRPPRDWLTVKGNVIFGLKMTGHSPAQSEPEARQWIEMVGLGKFENSYPHQLSGGMKQRVAIARALANQPRVSLMDEPFGALDAQTRCQMQSYLLQIWRNVDVTIVFITHDLEEAIYLADRILVLKRFTFNSRTIIASRFCSSRGPFAGLKPLLINRWR